MINGYCLNRLIPPIDGSGHDEFRLTYSEGASIYPAITANSDGVHVVWSERNLSVTNEEQRNILYRNKPFGDSWGETETIIGNLFNRYLKFPLFTMPGYPPLKSSSDDKSEESVLGVTPYGTPLYANINSDCENNLAIAVNGYARRTIVGLTELLWGVNLLQKNHAGEWEEQGFNNIGKIVDSTPSLTFDNSNVCWVAWTDKARDLSLGFSEEGKKALPRSIKLPSALILDEIFDTKHFYRAPSLAYQNGYLHLVFELNNWEKGMIYYFRLNPDNSEDSIDIFERLDSDPSASFNPKIIACNGHLYVVWADYDEFEKKWQVKHRRSLNNGDIWQNIQSISSEYVRSI
jgi:hypothetical protein